MTVTLSFPLLILLALQQPVAAPRGQVVLEPRRLSLRVQEESADKRGDAFVREVLRLSPRAGRFAQATLLRLRYDYPLAAREYQALRVLRPRDEWARAATFGLATVAQSRGVITEVDRWLGEAAREATDDVDSLAMSEVVLARAVSAARTKGPRAAIALIDSIPVAALPRDSLARAMMFCRRGNVFSQGGDRRARAEFAQGIAIARGLRLDRVEAECQLALYTHYVRVGQPDSGQKPRARATEILNRLGESTAMAAINQWNGYSALTLGDLRRAHASLREAEQQSRRSGNLLVLGWTSLSLAALSAAFGEFAEAERYLRQTQRLAVETGDSSMAEQHLGTSASIAMTRGDLAAAAVALSAFRRATEMSGRPNLIHAAMTNLAQIAARGGRSRDALSLLDSAAALRVRRSLSGFESSELHGRIAAYYFAGQLDSAAALVERLQQRLAPGQYAARFTLQVLNAGILARQGDAAGAESRLRLAEGDYELWHRALTEEQHRLRASQVNVFGLGELRGMGFVFEAMARRGETSDLFAFDERRRARHLREHLARGGEREGAGVARATGDDGTARSTGSETTLQEAQSRLPDARTAIVQFAAPVAAEPTTVMVITRGDVRMLRVASLDSLRPTIERFNTFVRQGTVPTPLALALGRLLLGEVAVGLPKDITRLVIVADGVLHRLPFDALLLAPGVHVVDRYATSIAPSSSVVATLWSRARRSDAARLLVFGDPALPLPRRDSVQPPYAEALFRSGALERLPASRGEVVAASRNAPRSVVLTGEGASEWALKHTPARDFRVVHFATHAMVDDWSIARTSLVLAPGDGEDGFVTPAELARLDLDADIVVLSACRTAAGEIVGSEGLRGLTAPLLVAGARAIIATQWDVRDVTAARLSGDLYRALRAGYPVIDAVRLVRLAARRRGDSSAVWAVLSVIGDSHAQPWPPTP